MSVAAYKAHANAMAQKYGVNPQVLANLIQTESNWQPGVTSPAGAQGIAQFMPATARSFGIDPFDPYQSIEAAAKYLRQALDRFGRYDYAVASYLNGLYFTDPKNPAPLSQGSQQYVSKVLAGVVPGAPRTGATVTAPNATGWVQQPWMTADLLKAGQGFGTGVPGLDSGGWYNKNTGIIKKGAYPGEGWVWLEAANVGHDFAVGLHTKITSPVKGVVTEVNTNPNHPWGIYVRVRDAQGYIHNFGHLDSANVKVGQPVTSGLLLGLSGNTGSATTGPHVSYDISSTQQGEGGGYIDPDVYLKRIGAGGTTTGGSSAGVESLMEGPGDWATKAEIADWMLDSIIDARPRVADYEDQEEYRAAMSEWIAQVDAVTATAKTLRDMAGGVYEGPDGILIPWGDLPPEQRAAIEQAQQMTFTKLMNDFKITTYGLDADRANADFSNKVSALGGKIQYDQLRLDQARDAINRALDAMAESRGRAQLITDTRRQAAPYATTAGKTSFTGRDLGGGIASLAAMAGMSMDYPVIQYPTSITLDPAGLIRQYDEQFGVTGPIPGIPDLLTQPGDLLTAPNLPEVPVLDTYWPDPTQAAAAAQAQGSPGSPAYTTSTVGGGLGLGDIFGY